MVGVTAGGVPGAVALCVLASLPVPGPFAAMLAALMASMVVG